MSLTMTCEEVSGLLSDYRDGVLPLGPTLKVKVHLYNCPACRALLATLRALPALLTECLEVEADFQARGEVALAAALARIQAMPPRPWPGSPVPAGAQALLAGNPDPALTLLAATHDALSRERSPLPGPYGLPQAILDQLLPEAQWRWTTDKDGIRSTQVLAGSHALLLLEAPPRSQFPEHRHLGSESLVVLRGAMEDEGRTWRPGDWQHHDTGSSHAPSAAAEGCLCLMRLEGSVRFLGPMGWLRNLGVAS